MSNQEILEGLFHDGGIDLRRGPLFDVTPPPLPSDAWDRVEGMLLGLAIGDALGNTTEGMLSAERQRRYGEVRDYRPNRFADHRAVGLPSDDTQLAFWTLERMTEDGGFVPERVAKRFAAQRIFGIGKTMKGFLTAFKSGTPWHRAGQSSGGNGALMRIAPMLVPHLASPTPALWVDTALSAMLTHNDSASTAASLAFVSMLWEGVATGAPPAGGWLDTYVRIARDLESGQSYRPRGGEYAHRYQGPVWQFTEEVVTDAWEKGLSVREACDRWYSGAYVMETIPSVLYLLMRHGDDLEQALVRAVNDTKDNDTVAAIVGAAVGAVHGRRALPSRWVSGLLGRTAEDDDGRVFELIETARARFWRG